MRNRREVLILSGIASAVLVMLFIVFPLAKMYASTTPAGLLRTITDAKVLRSISLSLYTAGLAALVSFLLGTPFAYVLARRRFPGQKLVESIIDLPMVIPHPVVGIAILGIVGRDFWLGRLLFNAGIRVMGSVPGIVIVLTFVGMPFYINAARSSFSEVSPRLENVSRSLGASLPRTFLHVTLPLATRGMVVGLIMCCARAISEFGAVVVVAYHPMVAPVLIYERFEAYGLSYSRPVAVVLTSVCLALFLILRTLYMPKTSSVR